EEAAVALRVPLTSHEQDVSVLRLLNEERENGVLEDTPRLAVHPQIDPAGHESGPQPGRKVPGVSSGKHVAETTAVGTWSRAGSRESGWGRRSWRKTARIPWGTKPITVNGGGPSVAAKHRRARPVLVPMYCREGSARWVGEARIHPRVKEGGARSPSAPLSSRAPTGRSADRRG